MTKACCLRICCDYHNEMDIFVCFYLLISYEKYDNVELIFYLRCLFVSMITIALLHMWFCACGDRDSSLEYMIGY